MYVLTHTSLDAATLPPPLSVPSYNKREEKYNNRTRLVFIKKDGEKREREGERERG